MALPWDLAASALPVLPERLLPQANAVRPMSGLLLWTERLLRQTIALRHSILLLLVRRLLLQTRSVHLSLLYSAGINMRPLLLKPSAFWSPRR